MTELEASLRAYTARYRRRILSRCLSLFALGAMVWATVGWRLALLQWRPAWRIGVPALGLLVSTALLAWWWRRRWLSPSAAAGQLDQAMGLQQRLMTAAEFSASADPPALYGFLLQDAMAQCRIAEARLPRAVDRTTLAVAALLLLLWLWPHRGATLFQIAHSARTTPQRMAQLPRPATPLPATPQTPSPSPQSSPGASNSPEGGGGAPQATGGDSGEARRSQASDGTRPSSGTEGRGSSPSAKHGDGSVSSNGHAAGASRAQGSGQDTSGASPTGQPTPRQDAPQEPGGNARATEQSSAPSSSGASQHQGAQASGSRAGSQDKAPSQDTGAQGQHAPQPSRESATSEGSQQGQAAQAAEKTSSATTTKGPSSSPSRGPSGGDQQALKAEIQQLLKEVSGELKDLQAQLAAAQDRVSPQAGTSTDPNLYEAPTSLDPRRGASVPMSLGTDAVPTSRVRSASGIGQPSGEVLRTGPQQRAESTAQLSDTPTTETPTARQVVPPEYREVFDRLHRQEPTPTRETNP